MIDGRAMTRDKEGPEGKFFFQCWGKGIENIFFVATASGKRLDRGLTDWNQLPSSERQPGAVKVPDLPASKSALPKPPVGGLIARVYIRPFVQDGNGGFVYERLLPSEGRLESEPTRDHLWLTRDEWRSLIPSSLKEGQEFPMPEAIADRIVRYHLNIIPDCVGGWWPPECVRSKKITLRVEKLGQREIRLRLEGSALLAGPAEVEESKASYRFKARLTGLLTYDKQTQAFSRLDIVAFGESREENGNRPRINKEGHRWIGIAFELADPAKPLAGQAPLAPPYFLLREGNDYLGKRR
jgi:hypothetical protein